MGNTFSSDDQQQPQYPAVQQTQPRELSQKHQKNCDQLNQTDFGFTGRREYESEYKGRQMTAAERAAFTELMEDDIYDDYKAIKKLIEEEEEEEEEGKEATPKKANTDPINEHYETLDSDTEEDENKTKLGDSTSEAKDGQSAPETANTDGGSGDDDGDEDDGYAANPKGSITYELDFRNPGTQKVYSKATSTGDITWRISAIPLGFRNTHLALFIEIVAVRNFHQGESFRTRFTLHLENRTRPDSTQFHQCEHEFRKPGEDWGFCEFAQLSEITRPENGYLSSEGALTVHATLEHLPDLIKDQTASAYNTRDATGYVGLRNQGATCYMNSLLQTLYHTSALTQAVFEMPTEQEGAGETPKGRKGGAKDGKPEESIPLALQELFFNMRFAKKAPSTQALTRSFGWDREDAFTQHDVQEFDRVLLDNLESKMVGTPLEGTVKRIFAGRERHSIRCTEVEYESAREEVFYDLSLDVRGFRTLEESFAAYTATEVLDGDNKYMAEGLGLQRAEKSCKFVSFPPVLHIQLKRWTYDPALDAQTKVNDRFEFPDKLDLTPYLDASAPRDEMYAYRLHAVLIHSGGAQSGHYYTFVRPTQAAKWFKFNDEYVTPATLSQVLESSYGGESEYYYNTAGEKTTSGEKFSNAYMLVYIREKSNMLFHIKAKEIPLHLHKRAQQSRDAIRARLRDYCESRMYARFGAYTEERMSGTEIDEDLFALRNATEFRVNREGTTADLYAEVARRTGRREGTFRVWSFIHRKNGTDRPKDIIPNAPDVPLTRFAKSDVSITRVFVEDSTEPPENFHKDINGLVFLCHYEPLAETGRLTYVGCHVIYFGDRMERIAEMARSAAGIPPNSKIAMFDLVRTSRVDILPLHKTVEDLKLRTGDVIAIQAVPSDAEAEGMRYPCIEGWFEYLDDRTTVSFRELSHTDTETARVQMLKKNTYSEVTAALAKALSNGGSSSSVDGKNIRLTGCKDYGNGPRKMPFTLSENVTLKTMLEHTVQGGQIRLSGVLYYEVLQRTLAEVENERVVDVVWMPMDMHGAEKITLRVARAGKIASILEQVAAAHPSQPGGAGKYRLLEVYRGKVYKEYSADAPLSGIPETRSQNTVYRVEEKTLREDKMGENDVRIQVVHLANESSETFFGSPFYLVVGKEAKLGAVKEEVQKRLGASDEDFAKCKFAFITSTSHKPATNDDDAIGDLVGTFEYFGIVHQDKKSAAALAGSISGKKQSHDVVAIKIKN